MFYGDLKDDADRQFLRYAVARLRRIFGTVWAGDNVILLGRNLAFRREERFRRALEKNAHNAQERSLELRLNTLIWAAEQALAVEGDFVECGVWRGFCTGVVSDYLEFGARDREWWLYDTFEGIPPGYDTEGHDHEVLREPGLHQRVVERFAPMPNVRVVQGAVPESFARGLPERVAFLHLDMNSSRSEIEALEVLWERIPKGGVIVFDDYGWAAYRRQQVAEDAFMAERGQRILELPTGQGLLIKR